MRLLVTGAAGFIGSNFVRYWHDEHPDDHVVALDALTYAGDAGQRRRASTASRSSRATSATPTRSSTCWRREQVDVVVNFAAESHNSLAVLDPARFFRTNVLGTQGAARGGPPRRGAPLPPHLDVRGLRRPDARRPTRRSPRTSPYRPAHAVQRRPRPAATTPCGRTTRRRPAGHDHQLRQQLRAVPVPGEGHPAASRRWRCDDEPLPLYASTQNRREWIHAVDHCRAIDVILERGRVGETYHVGTGVERSVEEIADTILGHARQAGVAEDDRARPSRPRPALRARLVEDPRRAGLGAADRVGHGHRRDDRLVRRQPASGGSRCATGRRWPRAPPGAHR